jgi:hypothetical protein
MIGCLSRHAIAHDADGKSGAVKCPILPPLLISPQASVSGKRYERLLIVTREPTSAQCDPRVVALDDPRRIRGLDVRTRARCSERSEPYPKQLIRQESGASSSSKGSAKTMGAAIPSALLDSRLLTSTLMQACGLWASATQDACHMLSKRENKYQVLHNMNRSIRFHAARCN